MSVDSPGNLPTSLGPVWVGEINGAAAQNCIHDFGPWPWQPSPTYPSPYQPPGWYPGQMTITLQPATYEPLGRPRLSDDDVDRIARRVVELMREAKP